MDHPALAILAAFSRAHPCAWKAADAARAGGAATWPPYCYLPADAAARALLAAAKTTGRPPLADLAAPGRITRPALMLAGLAAWRIGKVIVRPDPALRAALLGTPISGSLPGDLLRALPVWGLYLEIDGALSVPTVDGASLPLRGAFAWLDHEIARGLDTLCLLLDAGEAPPALALLPLADTLDAALDRQMGDWRPAAASGIAQPPPADYRAAFRAFWPPALSLLLYLCSEAPDYAGAEPPANPTPKRTRDGWHLFAAKAPRVVEVGARLGAALRIGAGRAAGTEPGAAAGTGRRAPIAHLRRAHWHLYWTGPRAGPDPQTPRVRWIAPTLIGAADDDAPAVIRPLRPSIPPVG